VLALIGGPAYELPLSCIIEKYSRASSFVTGARSPGKQIFLGKARSKSFEVLLKSYIGLLTLGYDFWSNKKHNHVKAIHW
jgi:hypothetical protein